MKKKLLLAAFLILLLTGLLLTEQSASAIDINGALIIARYAAGFPVALPEFADMNCDGAVTIIDAFIVARVSAGLPVNPGSIPVTVTDPNYPTRLPAHSSVELAVLQREFNSLNGDTLQAALDPYGLVSETTPSGVSYTPQPALMDENAVLLLARETLIKNQKFTNFNEQTEIDAAAIRRISTAVNTWHIIYPNQIYNGLTVIDTPIHLYVDAHIYTMSGHYYQNIYIPARENVTYTQACDLVTGTLLTYYDVAGNQRVYVICKQAVTQREPVKAIVPMKTAAAVELRVCWEVSISDGMWFIYMDVMTGEKIHTKQNFLT